MSNEKLIGRNNIKVDYSKNIYDTMFVNLKERTFKESPYDPDAYNAPYNPDDIYKRKNNYDTYKEMYNDDQCYVCMQLKKDLVLGSGFHFVSEDESQEEIVDFLNYAFKERLVTPFEDQLEKILSSYENGVSFTEKIFAKDRNGMLVLNCLKNRYPDTFLVHTDLKGNIEKYVQRGYDGQDLEIPTYSIIHDINNNRYDNPYGRSDFRSAYEAYFIKKHIIRYYAKFIEKYGTPVAVGRYDHNKAEAGAVDDLFNALKKLQSATALVLPKEIETELMETSSDGEIFIRGINLFNTFIARALLIPDLLGYSGGETSGGSFSLGKSQMDVFFKHIKRRRERLETLVNIHLVKPIIMYNFGDVENFPKFRLKPVQDEDAEFYANTWIEAVKSKLWEPTDEEINHLRELLKFPTSDVIERPKPPQIPSFMQPQEKEQDGNNAPEKEEEVVVDEGEEKDRKELSKKYNEELLDTPASDFTEAYDRKMNFTQIASHLDNMQDKGISRAEPIIEVMLKSIVDQIRRKKILENKDIDKISKLKIKGSKDLNDSVQGTLLDNYTGSKTIAMEELMRESSFKTEFATNLNDKEFVDLLEKETFDYVGDLQRNMTKIAKAEVVAAIKDGLTMEETAAAIIGAGRRASFNSIERYYRTKLTETMNRGRVDFFTQSGIVHGYQYSAILDSRTTDICSKLHNKKFRADKDGPAAGTPIPPMHFNCRSVLIPITKSERFNRSTSVNVDGDTVPINQFIEDNKGQGFSTE